MALFRLRRPPPEGAWKGGYRHRGAAIRFHTILYRAADSVVRRQRAIEICALPRFRSVAALNAQAACLKHSARQAMLRDPNPAATWRSVAAGHRERMGK